MTSCNQSAWQEFIESVDRATSKVDGHTAKIAMEKLLEVREQNQSDIVRMCLNYAIHSLVGKVE